MRVFASQITDWSQLMTLKKIISNIRGTDATSADLKTALSEIDINAAEATVVELEEERAGLLIDGTVTQIANVERRIEAANLECERTHAMAKEIVRRIELAESAEEQARRRKIYESAVAKQKKAKIAFQDYAKAAEKIRESLFIVCESEVAAADANATLPDGCKPIISAEREIRSESPTNWREPLFQSAILPSVFPNVLPFWQAKKAHWASPLDVARIALRDAKKSQPLTVTAK